MFLRNRPVLAAILLLGTAAHLPAALLLDFGPTAPTGAETNSPFHIATGSTESIWNGIGIGDTSSLLYSNGTTATGLSLNLGATSSDSSKLLDLGNQPGATNALGTTVNTGVYAGNSVGKDGIFEGSGSEVRSVGFQLTGLAAGTYDIYLTTRNTNASTGNAGDPTNLHILTSFAAAGTAGANFDFSSGFEFQALTFGFDSSIPRFTGAWVLGENYTKLTVTVEEGQALNVAVSALSPNGGDQTRGFLNSAAIVAVPEPATVISLLGGVGVLVGFRRARRG